VTLEMNLGLCSAYNRPTANALGDDDEEEEDKS